MVSNKAVAPGKTRPAAAIALPVMPARSSQARRVIVSCWCLLLFIGGTACGCSTRRASPFAEEPSPDLAVTTLEQPDIDTVASVIQMQATIRMGCDLAVQKPLPTPIIRLVDAVREQHLSRGRDLDALVRVKNAPAPENLGRHNSTLIDTLAQTGPTAWDPALITFFRTVHTDVMRVLRDAADRAQDPDVKSFAERQLPGVVSLLHQLDRLTEQTP
jgi:predicted outer membrane protein